MSVEFYVNPHVKRLSRYEVKEKELYVTEAHKLDANENLVLDGDWIRGLVEKALSRVDVRLYPPMYASKAVEAIASFLGLSKRNIIVDNGSDFIIDLIAKCFVGQGRAVIVEPTFEMYRFYVESLGGIAESFYMNRDFTINVDALLDMSKGAKAIFIASPNNPTGTQHSRDVIEFLAENFKGILVLDEAYSDFSDFTLRDLPFKYDNVIVLKSFSKVAGLAGLRIGYAIVNEKTYEYLSRLQSPYSVNALAQEVVGLILENWGIVERAISQIKSERDRMIDRLRLIEGVEPYSSKANFILLRIEGKSSTEVVRELALKGFLVRERTMKPLLENCIRVTVGKPEVNDAFIAALSDVLSGLKS